MEGLPVFANQNQSRIKVCLCSHCQYVIVLVVDSSFFWHNVYKSMPVYLFEIYIYIWLQITHNYICTHCTSLYIVGSYPYDSQDMCAMCKARTWPVAVGTSERRVLWQEARRGSSRIGPASSTAGIASAILRLTVLHHCDGTNHSFAIEQKLADSIQWYEINKSAEHIRGNKSCCHSACWPTRLIIITNQK